ncbi:hypothetical protein [Tritonibacter horizontis]|uniref:Uncharacterized protein n=1 Tax=Tritonibacter horizontis TaxID=1768241 RepID=A0A132C2B7_9RHOB|nr:hypothetical protein [Tritonibacter horizontis]KUP94656.1 hypothetical protein TRIHO_05820 [Tritonibacter horizontis]
MSAPDTNLNKQKRRHRGPLIGIGLVAIFGVGLILYWVVNLVDDAPEQEVESNRPVPAEIQEGDIEVPTTAPTQTVQPGDPEVDIEQ